MEKSADIKLGYSCNNSCIHCVIANQKKQSHIIRGSIDRTTDECKDIIKRSKMSGCNTIILTGGEPTIRKDFQEILKYAKSLGLIICLQTNARKFNDREFAKATSKYVDFFTVALHGASSEIHDRITMTKGSFDETYKGLKHLAEFCAESICGKIVISKLNCNDLRNILVLLNEVNIKNVNIAFPHAGGNAAKNFEQVIPYYRDITNELEECMLYAHNNDLKLELEAILPCAFEKQYPVKYFADFYYLDAEAELNQLDKRDSLDWNAIRKSSKSKGNICGECLFNNACEGYWMEYVAFRGFNEFSAITDKTDKVF